MCVLCVCVFVCECVRACVCDSSQFSIKSWDRWTIWFSLYKLLENVQGIFMAGTIRARRWRKQAGQNPAPYLPSISTSEEWLRPDSAPSLSGQHPREYRQIMYTQTHTQTQAQTQTHTYTHRHNSTRQYQLISISQTFARSIHMMLFDLCMVMGYELLNVYPLLNFQKQKQDTIYIWFLEHEIIHHFD